MIKPYVLYRASQSLEMARKEFDSFVAAHSWYTQKTKQAQQQHIYWEAILFDDKGEGFSMSLIRN